jgi:hypothetical protein
VCLQVEVVEFFVYSVFIAVLWLGEIDFSREVASCWHVTGKFYVYIFLISIFEIIIITTSELVLPLHKKCKNHSWCFIIFKSLSSINIWNTFDRERGCPINRCTNRSCIASVFSIGIKDSVLQQTIIRLDHH